MQANRSLVCIRFSPSPPESPGLCPQRWAPWICSPRAAAAQVGQGSSAHRAQRSLANLFCRLSAAQNRNPLFSLKAGITLEMQPAEGHAQEVERERETSFPLPANLQKRAARLSHRLDILWYKVIQGHWPIIFRPDLQNSLSARSSPGTKDLSPPTPTPHREFSGHTTPWSLPLLPHPLTPHQQGGQLCPLLSVSNARMCPSQSCSPIK